MRKEQRNPLVYDSTDSYCTQIRKKKGKTNQNERGPSYLLSLRSWEREVSVEEEKLTGNGGPSQSLE